MAHSSGRFAIVPARALDDTRMTPAALRLLVALCSYANRDGWCWPKLSTLAARLGVTRQAVSKQLEPLVEWGYVQVVPQFRADGAQQQNLYRILHDAQLPRSVDRWRPEYADQDGEVVAETFVDPGGQPEVEGGEQPVVGGPPVPVVGGPPQPGVGAMNTPGERTIEPHPSDLQRYTAYGLVDGWLGRTDRKPVTGRTTIVKAVERALAAGNDETLVEMALDHCNAFTVAGMEVALGRAREAKAKGGSAPPNQASKKELGQVSCQTCGDSHRVLDDDGLAHPCPDCMVT